LTGITTRGKPFSSPSSETTPTLAASRTDPDSPIPTVDVLLSERLTSLLNLILAIPPIHSTRYLQIALLLRFTASAREWITGYPLQWPSGYTGNSSTGQGSTPGEQAQGTVTLLLEFLQQLDDGWRMVLRQTPGAESQETGSAAPTQSLTATEKYARKFIAEYDLALTQPSRS
jgi:hypothetical protein